MPKSTETHIAIIDTKLDAILNQTTKTNGRVTRLESESAKHDSDIKTIYLELSNRFAQVSENTKNIGKIDDKLNTMLIKQSREAGYIGLIKQIVGTMVSVVLLAVLAKILGLVSL